MQHLAGALTFFAGIRAGRYAERGESVFGAFFHAEVIICLLIAGALGAAIALRKAESSNG